MPLEAIGEVVGGVAVVVAVEEEIGGYVVEAMLMLTPMWGVEGKGA